MLRPSVGPLWLGLLICAVLIIGWLFLLYRQRKAKKDHVSKHHPSIPILGFGGVNVPKEEPDGTPISFLDAQVIATMLHDAQVLVWETCIKEYGVTRSTNEAFQQGAKGWCVDEVGITNDPMAMSPKHPMVEWAAPHGGIKLLHQKAMYYWYAHEVHNVFRYVLHGMDHIYDTVDAEDKRIADYVQAKIEGAFAWSTYEGEDNE